MTDLPVYLDYNATTPLLPEVQEAMLPYLSGLFGNPSSAHPYGIQTRLAVENARSEVANLVGARAQDIIFTGGGTEANNLAIKGLALNPANQKKHIITSAIEHPAVLNVCRNLESQGFHLTVLPVDEWGLVHPLDLQKALTADTLLVSIMHANNEVGSLQPITELATLAKKAGAYFHTDAAQSLGKMPVDVEKLGIDLLTIVGHKLYAPKGSGALYVRPGTPLVPIIDGASHEQGLRPGTENVLHIVGLGTACSSAAKNLENNHQHLKRMRDRLWEELFQELGPQKIRRNGHPEKVLPNTLSVSFYGVEANTLLAEIQDQVACSAGAACHSDHIQISDVLKAMNIPERWAMGTVRLSAGVPTTEQEIDRCTDVLAQALRRLQPENAEHTSTKSVSLLQYTHALGCACKVPPAVLSEGNRCLSCP